MKYQKGTQWLLWPADVTGVMRTTRGIMLVLTIILTNA